MSEIIGNTIATPNPRPDWNQTDENKADYIKNKPDIAALQDGLDNHTHTKADVGLDNVENKSSEVIRSELTKENVTNALGYTAADINHTHNYAGASTPGGTADSAIKDSSGNVIVDTYLRKVNPVAYGSFTSGTNTTCGANNGVVEGEGTCVDGGANGAHAEGSGTRVYGSGQYTHVGGVGTSTYAAASFMFGHKCNPASHTPQYSMCFVGKNPIAHFGPRGANDVAATQVINIGGTNYTIENVVFAVGTGSESSNFTAIRALADGTVKFGKNISTQGADFAEYFEWEDGNPNDEDRRGLFVTLCGDKIVLANEGDDVIGIISGDEAVVGNTANLEWQGKYLTDVFGARLLEEAEFPAVLDKDGGVITPAYKTLQPIINPEYNYNEHYISREYRKEWDVVGLLGQIVVVDDGTCKVGGYVKPSINGVGTASDSGYRVMKRIDENHIKVLVK